MYRLCVAAKDLMTRIARYEYDLAAMLRSFPELSPDGSVAR